MQVMTIYSQDIRVLQNGIFRIENLLLIYYLLECPLPVG